MPDKNLERAETNWPDRPQADPDVAEPDPQPPPPIPSPGTPRVESGGTDAPTVS